MRKKAAFIAKLAHDATGALYKGEPYFERHVEEVAGTVAATEGATDEHVTVAYLHDIVEDTEVTLEGLSLFFDEDIVEAVDAITKREGEDYFVYIDRMKVDDLAAFVKRADLTVNMGNDPPERLIAKYTKALGIVEAALANG